MLKILLYIFATVGFIIIAFFMVIFAIATVRVIKQERMNRRSSKMADMLGCGERVFAVLTRQNGRKEIIG